MPIEPGTRLGQYEVLELIGEGAMGSVYRAYHAQLARTGAVKVMHAISPDSDSIARFRHEAQSIARMRHPNILNVFDFGEYEGTPYMIVEYVPGGNLAHRMGEGLLPWGTTLRFLHGIAAGLDYAHSQGIVHRDVKPANVLLEKDETLVLADFGLAKLLQGSSLQSLTGVTTGTPAYMAPEQVTGHEVGPAADRYSLATIAYEMLTGSIPFEGLGVIELLYAHVHSDPARPSTLNPQLSEKVDAVLLRGLAKAPGTRWATCEAFVNALGAALGTKAAVGVERTVAMASPPAIERKTAMAPAPVAERTAVVGVDPQDGHSLFAPPPTTVPPPVWAPAVAAERRARRRRMAVTVIAILAVLALTAGVISYGLGLSKPSFSVSSLTTEPGATLTVSAARLPANQVGQIELQSQSNWFWFRAGVDGAFTESIDIPMDIGIGDHHLLLCWGNSCPLQLPLTVVATGTLSSPTPSLGPSPTASGTPGARRTPGRSPSPGSSPKPSLAPYIARSPICGKGGTPVTVTGFHFTPGRTEAVTFNDIIPTSEGMATVASNGTFSRTFTVPSAAVPGSATIKVTGTNGTFSVPFRVPALLSSC